MRRDILLVSTMVMLLGAAWAQDAPAPAPEAAPAAVEPTPTPTPTPVPPPLSPALEFLKQLENKYADLETLHGTFEQLRVNTMFSEEVHSRGEFWYTKPNLFRCDYFDPSPAQFYLVGDTGYFYSPANLQLEKYQLETGANAPINGMLVGFGLSVDKVLEVFSVRMAEEQPADPNLVRIVFISRDTSRTLDFRRIIVTFDREKLEPRVLFMEEAEDTVEITLKKTEKNAPIPASTYETKFPDNVTVYGE